MKMAPTNSISVFRTLLHSIAVGFVFMLGTLAALFCITIVDCLRFGYLDLYWIYDRGGFPCIGIFAITSASYVVARMLPTKFYAALLLVSVCTITCWMIGGAWDILPRMYKSATTIHWLRIPFLLWLSIPPWLPAVLAITCRRIHIATFHQPPKSVT